jgi:cytochrome c
MLNRTFVTLISLAFAAPAFADGHASGDAEAGEKVFKKCKSCHMIVSDTDETIVKGGKTGPNLWGVVGRTAGTADFKYGKDLVATGEAGLVWDEEQFVAYVADPKAFLRETLDDSGAKSKMSFKLKDADDAANVWAYLASVSPAPEAASN